jgi:hypothetical protein
MTSLTYVKGATRPTISIDWYENGTLLDFSTGWTFTVKVFPYRPRGGTATFTKTAGITGASTSPNIAISWSNSDLGALTAGHFTLEVSAVNGSATYRRQWPLQIVAASA